MSFKDSNRVLAVQIMNAEGKQCINGVNVGERYTVHAQVASSKPLTVECIVDGCQVGYEAPVWESGTYHVVFPGWPVAHSSLTSFTPFESKGNRDARVTLILRELTYNQETDALYVGTARDPAPPRYDVYYNSASV